MTFRLSDRVAVSKQAYQTHKKKIIKFFSGPILADSEFRLRHQFRKQHT